MTAAQTVTDLLAELVESGVQLSTTGGQLTIRAPKGILTAAMRAKISESKDAILDLLEQRSREQHRLAIPQVEPDLQNRCQPFPLTDIQQAYWVGRSAVFEIGDVSIHLYSEIECCDLDIERFNRSWQRLIERHDMMRAIILPDGRQQILEHVPPYAVQVVDLRHKDPADVAAELAALRDELSHQVFQLDTWPTFDIRVTILDDRRARIHSSIDMLHIDGGSMVILNHEWVQLYHNPDLELEPLQFSYRDYVLAEQALHETELYRRSLDYWRTQIATLPAVPQLPMAKSPAALSRARFVRRSMRLDLRPWQQFKTLATQEFGLTPSVVLLSIYSEVLASWSKEPAFTINVTLFNRLPFHPQVNDILGDFTSMIFMAVDHTTAESFAARARALQEKLWSHLEHRYVSGVAVLHELGRYHGKSSGVSMPIVFTSLLSLGAQAFGPPRNSSSASIGELIYRISQTPQVWMDLQVYEEEGTLLVHFDVVEELFPPGMVDEVFDAFCTTVHSLAADAQPWKATRHLVALPDAQARQRAAVNATEGPLSDALLHTLFAAQVARQPQHPAVVTSSRAITYGELDLRARQVGRWLRRQGARPNQLVAVVMEKGWEQVVAVLGVLQSGAAYLPIDPELPRERLWYLLENGEVQLALTQPWLDERLEWPAALRRLCVTADRPAETDDPGPLEPAQSVQDLAYVIYTSGSTGRPKGVMIDHRGAVNTILDLNERFKISPADRVLALSALSFDLSVYDIFGMLAAGGTLVIPDAAEGRNPAHWAELMAREQVTLWNSVPALMEMLVEYVAGQPGALPGSLRLIFMSGDWIPVTLPDQIRAVAGNAVELIGMGGATEASIWSILYPIGAVDPAWKSIPYGRPMVNQRFYVLDHALEPRIVWVPGQLYIGGVGLAQGYWRDEAKTRASFFVHPHTGERLYRTGDMGRYLPDGNIEFLGREDAQVKIRGHRIELGEIEAALLQHPAVRSAVVMAAGAEQKHKQLIAYVVPEQAPQLEPGQHHQPAPQSPPEAQQDPLALLEFKLQRHGLRRLEPERERIRLIKPELDEALQRAYLERRSQRTFQQEPLSLEQFNAFFNCLHQAEVTGQMKYRYPSAGNLYPVQVYVYVVPGRVGGVAGGIYYYHPRDHELVMLAPGAQIDREAHFPINQAMFDESAFSIFLIGQLQAITPIYGELARDFCLLEAGYISQLLMMHAPAHAIGLCPIGALAFERIRHLFALDETSILLHSHICGGSNPREIAPQDGSAQTLQGAAGLLEQLRLFLQSKLPDHMIPSAFIIKDGLPLTYNGKVDRNALLDLAITMPAAPSIYVAPENAIEQLLVTIIREFAELEIVSTHANFFDLGINSIQVVKIYNRLKEALNIDFSITEVFRHPTIKSLADRLSQDQSQQSGFGKSQRRAEARRATYRRRGPNNHDGDRDE